MSSDQLKALRQMNTLSKIREFAKKHLTKNEHKAFAGIRARFDNKRIEAELFYKKEYQIRVDVALRLRQDKAGAKNTDYKPRFFGIDAFNTNDLTRLAQTDVRFDHKQSMMRLDAMEFKKCVQFVEKSSQRKKYLEEHKKSTERRAPESRRVQTERRRSRSPVHSQS